MSCATLVKIPLALKRLQRSEQCSYITGWFRTLANKIPSPRQALDRDVMPASRICIILFQGIAKLILLRLISVSMTQGSYYTLLTHENCQVPGVIYLRITCLGAYIHRVQCSLVIIR